MLTGLQLAYTLPAVLLAFFSAVATIAFFVMIPINFFDKKKERDRWREYHLKDKTDHELFIMAFTEAVKTALDVLKGIGKGIRTAVLYIIPFFAIGLASAAAGFWGVLYVVKAILATVLGGLPI